MAKTVKTGLMNQLNSIRETASDEFKRQVPEVRENMGIEEYGLPILNYSIIKNEWIDALINKIVLTIFDFKMFNNPLKQLEGQAMPLGNSAENIYVNPAKGRNYNANDFQGLLQKYEADVKVQYFNINSDRQYAVTINDVILKRAFKSWDNLETMIYNLTNSLYNGAYIDEYNFTKALISNAYRNNYAVIEQIDEITDEAKAKAFTYMARRYFLDFQSPSSNYNAWSKVGGYGRPIVTWTEPDRICFIIKNEYRAYLDVNVLASAFNIDKAELLGRIITVDNFDIYNDEGVKEFDGSNIVGMIADLSWFKIMPQDFYMDLPFRNPNNRSIQYYLNVIKTYNFSLFANAVIFATEAPSVPATGLTFDASSPNEITKEQASVFKMNVTPVNTTDTLQVTSIQASDDSSNITSQFTISYNQEKKEITITPQSSVAKASVKIAVSCGGASTEKTVTIAGV